ncbi:MAG: methyltransferase domain-containing protein [Gemmatimonadota bacterium]
MDRTGPQIPGMAHPSHASGTNEGAAGPADGVSPPGGTRPGAGRGPRDRPEVVRGPSALDIARLSRQRGLAEGRQQCYRYIARLTDLTPGMEFLIAPAAAGEAVRFLATLTGAHGAGVDPDAELVGHATQRALAAGLEAQVHFDQASPTDLPYTDAVFDVAIGEIGLSAVDAGAAVAELARVTRPGGAILLVQPVWTADVDERRRDALTIGLGFRPLLPQRWKQLLLEAGAEDLYVDDLSEVAASRTGAASVRTLTDFFTVRDRLAVTLSALRRWGWAGASAAIKRGNEIRHLVSRDRVLGLSLIRATMSRAADIVEGGSDETKG